MTGNLFPDPSVHNPVKPPQNRTAEARLEYLCYIFDVALTAYDLHGNWPPQTIAELRRQIDEARAPRSSQNTAAIV